MPNHINDLNKILNKIPPLQKFEKIEVQGQILSFQFKQFEIAINFKDKTVSVGM